MPSPLQNLRWPWAGWPSDEARRRITFHFGAFRAPLILILAALLLERSLHYGALPLGGYVAARFDYGVARLKAAHGDNAEALEWIRASLLHSRTNVAAWQLAARISAQLDSPEATYCWQRVDQLSPGIFATQIRLAESALRYQQLDAVADVLQEIAPADQESMAFLCAAGQLAMASGERDEAQSFFLTIANAPSKDAPTTLALAKWYATSGRPGDLDLANRNLLGLIHQPQNAAEAYRLLVAVAQKKGDRAAALKWDDALLAMGDATLADRVARLDLLRGPGLDRALSALLSSTRADDIVPVLDWMAGHGRAEQALAWIHQSRSQIQPPMGRVRAECLSSLQQWKTLRDVQATENWGRAEQQRLLYLARAQIELGAESDARVALSGAVSACRDYPDYLSLLDYLKRSKMDDSGQPFWIDARRQVWTKMISRYPNQAWIVRLLLRDATARHDSLTSENCWMQLAAIDPGDVSSAARGARICLLRGVRVEKSSTLILKLHADNPENVAASNARAYDLFRQGRFAEALGVMGGLGTEDLNCTELAPDLGALLAAAGPVEQARAHLRIAQANPDLLPEEMALVQRSLDLLAYREGMTALQNSPGGLDSFDVAPHGLTLAPAGDSTLSRVWESIRLSREQQADEAARQLSGIDPTPLDAARLSIYLGEVLDLAGRHAEAPPYLELSVDLPFESTPAKLHKALAAWWSMPRKGNDSAQMAGLFATYRALDLFESDGLFWLRDEPRETELTRKALLCGYAPEAVQERLHGLLRHVPATPEIQTQLAYALLLEGLPRAARERMESLAPAELAQTEASFYYGVILAACGEKRQAGPILERAEKSVLRPEEVSLLQRAEKML